VLLCIDVTDEAGDLIAFERMEGGKISSITIAIDEAFTAAAARKATHDYGSASQPGGAAWGIAPPSAAVQWWLPVAFRSPGRAKWWAASASRQPASRGQLIIPAHAGKLGDHTRQLHHIA